MKEKLFWPDRNTVLHLRFPFSFFLLPVFMFALSTAEYIYWPGTFLAFVILHLLIFPSSNGYNSFHDRDETSIGGLKNPPPVSKGLYFITLILDSLAILLGLFVSLPFAALVLLFILVSRAYSSRSIRLKRYPIVSFIIVSTFQGALVYLMSLMAITHVHSLELLTPVTFICMGVATLFIGSIYPLTQIYQHQSDKNDGIISLSYKLGYLGTFVFSSVLFMAATSLVYLYFNQINQLKYFQLFLIVMLPVVIWFLVWFIRVLKNRSQANYSNTMLMNIVTSTCMNLFFLFLTLNRYENWY